MSAEQVTPLPRDKQGRFLAIFCNDLNCSGVLMLDGSWHGPVWRCDGLTFDGLNGPLRACTRVYDAALTALAHDGGGK